MTLRDQDYADASSPLTRMRRFSLRRISFDGIAGARDSAARGKGPQSGGRELITNGVHA